MDYILEWVVWPPSFRSSPSFFYCPLALSSPSLLPFLRFCQKTSMIEGYGGEWRESSPPCTSCQVGRDKSGPSCDMIPVGQVRVQKMLSWEGSRASSFMCCRFASQTHFCPFAQAIHNRTRTYTLIARDEYQKLKMCLQCQSWNLFS